MPYNPMESPVATTAIRATSRGDELLDRSSTLVKRYSDVRDKLSVVCQRVGLNVTTNQPSDREEGFGFIGRMDLSLLTLYDTCDDIDGYLVALDEAF